MDEQSCLSDAGEKLARGLGAGGLKPQDHRLPRKHSSLSYVFEGKKILAATSRSWVVDAAYRSYSLLLLDYFFAQTNVDLFLTTTLNTDALEGFLFFAPSPVPVGDWDHSNFWVTNYAGFLTSSLMVKEIPFAKPLSYPLSIPLFIRDRL